MKNKTLFTALGLLILVLALTLVGLWINRDKGSNLPNLTIQGGEKNPTQNTGDMMVVDSKDTKTSLTLENVKDNSISLKEIGYKEKDGMISFTLTGNLIGVFDKVDVAGLLSVDKFSTDFTGGNHYFTIKFDVNKSSFREGKYAMVVQAIRTGNQDLKSQWIYVLLDK